MTFGFEKGRRAGSPSRPRRKVARIDLCDSVAEREGQAHAPAALMTANGLQFTVTGLNSGTQYGYSVTAKDANDQPVATYSGEFTTTSEGIATGVEEVSSSLQGGERGRLILCNGQIFILRGDKTYTLQGQELR